MAERQHITADELDGLPFAERITVVETFLRPLFPQFQRELPGCGAVAIWVK
jgi:hypothetical protein